MRAPAGYESTERITLTLSMLNRARTALFLATGEGKRAAVATVLRGPTTALALPAARVQPTDRLVWFLDQASAGSIG